MTEAKLTPEEFKKAIRKLRSSIRTAKIDQLKTKNTISNQYNAKIRLVKQEKSILENKYLVDNPLGILAYVDHIKVGGDTIYYDTPIQITYETRRQQYSKVLKNGQVRYYTRNVKCIVFTSDQKSSAYIFDVKVAEIRQAIKRLNEIIEAYPESKNKLDAEMLVLDKKLVKLNSAKEKEINESNNLYSEKIVKYRDAIDKAISKATPEQLKELHKRRRVIAIACLAVASMIIIPVIIKNISNAIIEHRERGRNYYIDISDTFEFDCDGKYDEDINAIECTEREISGSFSHYDSTVLESGWSTIGIFIDGGSFIKKLSTIQIPASYYETNDYKIDTIKDIFSKTNIKLNLYNEILKEQVFEKEINIHWNFSEADLKLFEAKNKEWKVKEQERKAKEEKERKEKEEAARKEAERKAAEEALKKQNECTAKGAYYSWDGSNCNYNPPAPAYSTPSNSSNSSSGSKSNSSSSPNSGVKNVVSGYCNDGTYVTGNPSAKGKANACYGHKGWRDY